MFTYTTKMEFTKLMEATIASSGYNSTKRTVNFIAHIKPTNDFIMYALKQESHTTICSTIFKIKSSSLKKYSKEDDFKLLDKGYGSFFE